MKVNRIDYDNKKQKLNNSNAFTGQRFGNEIFSDWFTKEVKEILHLPETNFIDYATRKATQFKEELRDELRSDWGIFSNLFYLSGKAEVRKNDYLELRGFLKKSMQPVEEKTDFDYPLGKFSSQNDYNSQNPPRFLSGDERSNMDELYGKPGEYNPLING